MPIDKEKFAGYFCCDYFYDLIKLACRCIWYSFSVDDIPMSAMGVLIRECLTINRQFMI